MTLVDGKGELRTLSGAELDPTRVYLGLLGAIVQLKVRIIPQQKLQYGFEKYPDDNLDQNIESLVKLTNMPGCSSFPRRKSSSSITLTKYR